MTKQIPDTVAYRNEEYILAGLKGNRLFTPNDFDIVHCGVATACYRGYFCQYSCDIDKLFLTQLTVFNTEDQLPLIHDVIPENILNIMAQYQNLKIHCSFSGGMVIVTNPVEPDRDMLPNPLKYEKFWRFILNKACYKVN